MEVFDYVSMAVGSLLIVIGLFLFVSGKKDSAKSNQVEGFGIKLNVSNPSIILIVLGIGLLLVPRLLPKPTVTPDAQPTQAAADSPVTRPQTQAEFDNTEVIAAPAEKPEVIPIAAPPASVFLPVGVWQLSGYEVDDEDWSDNVRGSINFAGQSPTNTGWAANFLIADDWGNVSNFQYQGVINGNGSAYNISITGSNDPNFFFQGATPLELHVENGGVLHMGYIDNGSNILLHWVQ